MITNIKCLVTGVSWGYDDQQNVHASNREANSATTEWTSQPVDTAWVVMAGDGDEEVRQSSA